MSRSPRIALLAAAVFAAAALIVWAAAFRSPGAAELDATTLAGFMGLRGTGVEGFAVQVAQLADPLPFGLASAAIIALALVRRRPALAVMSGVVLVGANATTQLLKVLTAEPRGPEWMSHLHVAPESWPSGHATAAMTLALCLVAVAPAGLRPLAAAVGGTFALAVSYSILVLGWHFPSDVVGGFCVAAAWTLAGIAAVWAIRPERRGVAARERVQRAEAVLGPSAAAALAVGAVVIAGALARPAAALAYAESNTAFVVAAAVIGSAALALAAALAAALRT
jgi:membrane-associated phospholipid phosphatase